MKGRDYWCNEIAKGIIRAQSGDLQVLEALLDEIESLEKSQLAPVAADSGDSPAFELDTDSELYQRRQALIEAARRR